MSGIRFDRRICEDLAESLKHEWLATNGLGELCAAL